MLSQQLLLTIFLPLSGAVGLWFAAPAGRHVARAIALAVTLLTLFCAAQLVVGYPADGASSDFALTNASWLATGGAPIDIRFSIGLDGLGVWLFGLSALLFVTSVLVSWEAVTDGAPLFYAMLLLLEFGCLEIG